MHSRRKRVASWTSGTERKRDSATASAAFCPALSRAVSQMAAMRAAVTGAFESRIFASVVKACEIVDLNATSSSAAPSSWLRSVTRAASCSEGASEEKSIASSRHARRYTRASFEYSTWSCESSATVTL